MQRAPYFCSSLCLATRPATRAAPYSFRRTAPGQPRPGDGAAASTGTPSRSADPSACRPTPASTRFLSRQCRHLRGPGGDRRKGKARPAGVRDSRGAAGREDGRTELFRLRPFARRSHLRAGAGGADGRQARGSRASFRLHRPNGGCDGRRSAGKCSRGSGIHGPGTPERGEPAVEWCASCGRRSGSHRSGGSSGLFRRQRRCALLFPRKQVCASPRARRRSLKALPRKRHCGLLAR